MVTQVHNTANTWYMHAAASLALGGWYTSDALICAGAAGRAGAILGPAE